MTRPFKLKAERGQNKSRFVSEPACKARRPGPAPGEMQWKVARLQGSCVQAARKAASGALSAAGPAASTRKGCSTSRYTGQSQSQSQGCAAAGAVSRSSSAASSAARPLPSAAPPHLGWN